MPLCENKHPSIVFEERNVNCPLCVLQSELTASKEDNTKLVEELSRATSQIERVLDLVSKNEKRRSSGLVGCDEIRKTIKGE